MGDLTQEISRSDIRRYKQEDRSKYQEICDLADILKVHRLNYANSKIMWDALSSCLTLDGNVDDNLKAKIRNILCAHEIEPYTNLASNNIDVKLLGLSETNQKNVDLSYEERRKLKEAFENALVQLSNKMQSLFKLETSSESTALFKWSLEDKILLEYRNKLVEVQGMYVNNLLDYYNLLEEILQLRINDLTEMSELKSKHCGLELQKCNLQTEILLRTTRINIFTETNHALDAYRMLIADIKQERVCCEEEIEKLKLLKEKYNQVTCKQYNEILKDYVSHKRDLDMKKLLFKNIKSQ